MSEEHPEYGSGSGVPGIVPAADGSRRWDTLPLLCIGVAVFVVAAWISYGWWLDDWPWQATVSPADHGAMYGGLNALFSGLAFTAVATAVVVQLRQLRAQNNQICIVAKQTKETMESLREQIRLHRLQATAAVTPEFQASEVIPQSDPEPNTRYPKQPHTRFHIALDRDLAKVPIYDLRVESCSDEDVRADPTPILTLTGKTSRFYIYVFPMLDRQSSRLPIQFRMHYRDALRQERDALFEIRRTGNSDPEVHFLGHDIELLG